MVLFSPLCMVSGLRAKLLFSLRMELVVMRTPWLPSARHRE